MSGYAARLRLLRQALRDSSGPAKVGAAGQGGAAVVFADGTRLVIFADQIELSVPSANGVLPAVDPFASQVAGMSGLPLVFCNVDIVPPDPTPSPG